MFIINHFSFQCNDYLFHMYMKGLCWDVYTDPTVVIVEISRKEIVQTLLLETRDFGNNVLSSCQ